MQELWRERHEALAAADFKDAPDKSRATARNSTLHQKNLLVLKPSFSG
jgi:hypothetical protein